MYTQHVILCSLFCLSKLAVCQVKPCPWPYIQFGQTNCITGLWEKSYLQACTEIPMTLYLYYFQISHTIPTVRLKHSPAVSIVEIDSTDAQLT